MTSDYNPSADFSLTPRDEIALRAPLPQFIFQPSVVVQLLGLKGPEDIRTIDHMPLAIARFQFMYADAFIQARQEVHRI